ncbi:hypothetical protein DRN73_09920 [Candidatus Pacearchaeota archaeon]|nr:MAG: hypothetical protein DRN73_09920 [Candidatus Pacearchaeota archaeon]
MFKLTAKLDDEYREKVEFLKERLKKPTLNELIAFIIDSFVNREKLDSLQKLELRIEELASRIGYLEAELRDLRK